MTGKIPLESGIIYGPIPSRRLGQSLGINLLPTSDKFCDFNCLYCFFGPTLVDPATLREVGLLPTPSAVELGLRIALLGFRRQKRRVDYITFSGNGEPTLHPAFPEIVDRVMRVRDELAASVPICVFTNGSTLGIPVVRRAIMRLDKSIVKLDSVVPEIFKELNRPLRAWEILDTIRHLKQMRHFVIQAAVTKGKVSFSEPRAFRKWIEVVRELKPDEVQIYSLNYPPAESGLERVHPSEMRTLARRVEKLTGTTVYYYN